MPLDTNFAVNFRTVLATLVGSPQTDGELLRRYAAEHDELAFTELVRRLGPSVWSTCRRLLAEAADAEDAFQVTFMVLARKAGSIHPPGKVAAWVQGTAVLAARKARARNRREAARIRYTPDLPERASLGAQAIDPALYEELERLPARFRLPILLCELREMTAAQAARELDWPVGTVASRLSRGRTLLMERLRRRGFAAAIVTFPISVANAAVPPRLLADTLTVIANPGHAGSASVLALTTKVLSAMSMTKLSLIAAGTIATAALALSVGAAMPAPLQTPPPDVKPAARTESVDPVERFKLENLLTVLKPEEIQTELGLSAEQRTKLDEARKTAREQMEAAMLRPLPGVQGGVPVPAPGGGGIIVSAAAGPNPAFAEATAAFDKSASGILTPAQTRRLRQLTIQIMGPNALLDRRVIRALALTAAQEDAIDAELPALAKITDASAHAEASEKIMKSLLKTLSAEQRTKWETLIGTAMPTSDLVKANPLFAESPLGFTVTGRSVIIPGPGGPPPGRKP